MSYRDELAEEMGYIICPLCVPEYVFCDEECEKCEHYINFMEALKERGEINKIIKEQYKAKVLFRFDSITKSRMIIEISGIKVDYKVVFDINCPEELIIYKIRSIPKLYEQYLLKFAIGE